MQKDDFIAKKCRVCGKTFEVLHPSRWAYKKGGGWGYKWYCSWTCLRKEEKERENVRSAMPAGELHKKAMEICIEGGDPIAFLKEHGSENPEAMWWRIKNKFKKTGHDMYEQLPDDQKIRSGSKGGRKKREKPAEEKTDISAPPVAQVEMTKEEKPKLRIRSLDSEVVAAGVYTRGDNKIQLEITIPLMDPFRLRLTTEEWVALREEINTMLDQFDMKEA